MSQDEKEKFPEERVEVVSADRNVFQEDEKFEWREIIRGRVSKLATALTKTVINCELFLGLTEIQAWFTGLAYMCMNVGLYSFSLFL